MTFINEMKEHTTRIGGGNLITVNEYVLDEEPLKQLKNEFESHVREYFHQVWNPKTDGDVDVYITTSWLTYTSKHESHHPHAHPNSFISGTFYPKVGDDDEIVFPNDRIYYSNIKITAEEATMYNSEGYREPVYNGRIMLWPSTLDHYVAQKMDDQSRICLAFNTWIKGTVGEYSEKTELKLSDEPYRGN